MSGGDWKELYQGALTGDLDLVRYHLSAGVDPNYQHPEVLCTPLVASLVQGHDAVAHYLLAHGADPALFSEFDGMTPLQAARKHGRVEFVALLHHLDRGVPRRPFWWRWLPI